MPRIALALMLLAGPSLAAHVVVEPNTRYQTIVGYGQGSMDQWTVPWYTELSAEARNEFLDRLYTLDGEGLGLSICRTYICAGDAPGHAHMSRRPGGSVSPLGYEPEDGVFQWEGHEASLWHAQGAQERGAFVVAFFTSPPWWMTISGCTSGAAGGTANLKPGLEGRFAVYICEVLKQYRDAWGVDFDRVCPTNEPEALWWKEQGGQDGCHVDAEQAGAIMAALGARLQEYGLRARVQGPEAAFSGSLDYVDIVLANPGAYDALAELTCHQYIADFHSLRRWPLRSHLHGKGLWMSEWGDWTNHGLPLAISYALKLHEAHRLMQAEAWCMWEPAFLFEVREGRTVPNTAFFAVAQFTRFARPAMVVIEATDTTLKTTAYLDEATCTLILVTVNDRQETVELTYDLSAFGGLSQAQAWRTSGNEHLAALDSIPCQRGFTAQLPAQSVTTFRLSYERIVPPLIVDGGFETGKLGAWVGEPATHTGVQQNYPQGGSNDGYIDPGTNARGQLTRPVSGLEPGQRYALTAACATSGLGATLSATGAGLAEQTTVSGGGYQLARIEFIGPPDGTVRIAYTAGPDPADYPWATIDNVRLSPVHREREQPR